MSLEFRLPMDVVQDSSSEGFVVNWFKEEGDTVRAGELLLEVQFEKVNIEIDAPTDGVLIKILVPQGEVVRPGQPLCIIEEEKKVEEIVSTGVASQSTGGAAGSPEEKVETATRGRGGTEVRATPAARRLARELGIRLEEVRGSGPGGRITEADVRAHAAQATSSRVATEVRRERLSPAQRVTGQRMLESLRNAAQYTLGRQVNVTALVKLREELKRSGSPVTLSDLIHRAVIMALLEHPRLQSKLEGDEVIIPSGVNLGFAVARGDDLLVPVIRDAHTLSLEELAGARRRLTEAVLKGRVEREELTGGTFTVTNLGPYGVDFFTPVINPPESAILGVGRIVQQLVLDEGVRPAHFITLSLTVDHRVVNGAPAAAFLARVAELLSAPEGLISNG